MLGSKSSGNGFESHDALFGPRSYTQPADSWQFWLKRAAIDP